MTLVSGDLAAGLQRARRPIGEARGLPNGFYTDPDLAAEERDRLLARRWLAVATGAQVPAAGDIRPIEVMGIPLILVRDRDGTLRLFHNVCSHRGMPLVEEACRAKAAITCPYHRWTYGLDGRLRATPFIGGPGVNQADGFERDAHGLKPVRMAVWFDVVFADLSGAAPDFAGWIAPLAGRWAEFDADRLGHAGADSRIDMTLACNWKLAVENYCEAYHLPWVHPGLNSYSRLEDHYSIAVDGRMAGQGTTAYTAPLDPTGRGFPAMPGLGPSWERGAEYIALFPNLLLGVHRDHLFAGVILPEAPDRTRELFEIYYFDPAALAPDMADLRAENTRLWRSVFEEDRGVVEGMQRGRASPAFDGGVFSPVMDPPTHCFHRWVAEALLESPNA